MRALYGYSLCIYGTLFFKHTYVRYTYVILRNVKHTLYKITLYIYTALKSCIKISYWLRGTVVSG